MKHPWTIYTFIGIILMGLSCGDNAPLKPKDLSPQIIQVSVPATLWTGTEMQVVVRATVADEQGLSNIDSVFVTVLKPDSSTLALHSLLNDSAARGDLIAFDGVYSRSISTSFTQGVAGRYYFIFQAVDIDGHFSDSVVEPVPALAGSKNGLPSISDISLPQIITVDASVEYTYSVQAEDPQGPIDLKLLIFRVHKQDSPTVIHQDTVYDDGLDPDQLKGDGIFSGTFTSTFADSLVGYYPLSFQVFDLSGDSTDYVRRDIRVINEANGPPYIFNLSVPDTFDSGSSTNFFIITLQVMDPQGLADIDSVHFTSLKPDSTWANNGNPIPLFDDGNPTYGDAVAGDGIFSFRAVFDPTAQKGNYIWTFLAVDRSGLRSNIIVHILTVI